MAILVSITLSGGAVVGIVLDRLEAMSAPLSSIHGLRLGATPDEVRSVREGEWTSSVDGTGDLVLSRDGESYAFHEGALVAVDLLLARDAIDAQGPDLVVTEGSVLARDFETQRVRVRLVSRTCPTHAETARILLERARD
jgi:hypothetical protein